jgi:hypothetical protein
MADARGRHSSGNPNGGLEVVSSAPAPGEVNMSNKPDSKTPANDAGKKATKHPGMMGDGTEEQNLGQRGDPAARIKKDEVDAAFAKGGKKS